MTERPTSEMPLRFASLDHYARVVAAYTPVFLYPVANLYVTSDRPIDLNGSVWEPEDWVFWAIAGADFEEALRSHSWPALN